MLEGASLADQVVKLKEEVGRLNDRVRILTLENVGLSGLTTELEVDLVPENVERERWKRMFPGSLMIGSAG